MEHLIDKADCEFHHMLPVLQIERTIIWIFKEFQGLLDVFLRRKECHHDHKKVCKSFHVFCKIVLLIHIPSYFILFFDNTEVSFGLISKGSHLGCRQKSQNGYIYLDILFTTYMVTSGSTRHISYLLSKTVSLLKTFVLNHFNAIARVRLQIVKGTRRPPKHCL